jgi:hypothetical protein
MMYKSVPNQFSNINPKYVVIDDLNRECGGENEKIN